MVVPDSTLIAEIILFGEGFNNTKVCLARQYGQVKTGTKKLWSTSDEHRKDIVMEYGLNPLTTATEQPPVLEQVPKLNDWVSTSKTFALCELAYSDKFKMQVYPFIGKQFNFYFSQTTQGSFLLNDTIPTACE